MGYKIIFTSDVHGNKEFYTHLINVCNDKKAKALVLGGDIFPHAHLDIRKAIDNQRRFISDFLIPELKKFKGDIFLIMGNDDFASNMDLLEKADYDGALQLIHFKNKKIGRWEIAGYSFVPQMPFLLKDWEKLDDNDSKFISDQSRNILSVPKPSGTIDDDFKSIAKMSNPKKTIYVIHTPPFNTKLDIISSGIHVGSKSVRGFIEKHQPLLTLHGHIHESPDMSGSSIDKIGEAICLNVGRDYQNKELRYAEIDLDNLDNILFLRSLV